MRKIWSEDAEVAIFGVGEKELIGRRTRTPAKSIEIGMLNDENGNGLLLIMWHG